MKNILLIGLSMLFSQTHLYAYKAQIDGIYYNFSDTSAVVTYLHYEYKDGGPYWYSDYQGNIIIPESVSYQGKTYPVTSIGAHAFINCVGLKSIIIPSSVTNIGLSAFEGCSKLTSIELPNRVTNIGAYSFRGCTGLIRITIPNNVTYIGGEAFCDCTGLKIIDIPNSLTKIGSNAFSNTAWYNGLPDGLVYAGNVAYKYKGAMSENTNIILKDGTLGIAASAFDGCIDLEKITIPNSVVYIGEWAFNGCVSLKCIEFPNSVEYVGTSVLSNCTSLESIILPFVGDKPHVETDPEQYPFGYIFGTSSYMGGIATTQDYTTGSTVSRITSSTYYIPSSLKSVTIKECNYIPSYSFNNCTGLSSIKIPSSVMNIGENAFYGCCIDTLVCNTNAIGTHFQGNLTLKSVVFGDEMTSILTSAFSGCLGLEHIVISSGVTSVGKQAFENCGGELYLNSDIDNFPSSEEGGFNGAKFSEVVIGDNVTKISKYAFYDMLSLTKISLGSNVNKIGSYAFTGCSNLSEMFCKSATPAVCAPTAFDEDTKLFCDVFVPEGSLSKYQSADQWKEFRSIGTFTEPISTGTTYNMADADVYSSGGTIVYDELSYTRTFSNTHWQALYVPFSISVDSLSKNGLQVAELNDTHQWDFNGDGVADSTRVEFFTLTSGSTEANYPYLIRATEPTTLSLTLKDIEVKAAEENSIECSSTKQKFTFVGTYTGVSGADMYANNYYGMSGGGLKRVSNNTVSLKPQRWYMKIENKNGSPVNYFAPSIRFTVDGIDEEEEETSAIVDMCTESRNRHKAFYSLEGIRQHTAPTQRGMYVRQGKKLIIR